MDSIEFAGLAVSLPAGDEFGGKRVEGHPQVFWEWAERFPKIFVLTVIQIPYRSQRDK
jgi:hypothetical protein